MSINEALANSIARIVDDRVQASFAQRDNVLSQMHQSLQDVASLLKERTLNMQTLQTSIMSNNSNKLAQSDYRHQLVAPTTAANKLGFRTPRRETTNKHTIPFRPLGGSSTPGYFSPRTSKNHRGIVMSSKTRSGKNRIGYESKTHGNAKSFLIEKKASTEFVSKNNNTSSIYVKRDHYGTLLIPRPNELPRVARKEFHVSHGWTSPRNRHEHNTEEYIKKRQRVTTSNQHRLKKTESSKTAIFRPTTWRPSKKDKLPPAKGLVLEWVYGYGRSVNLASKLSNSNDIYRLKTSELVWAVAGVCVMFDENRMTQRFFVGHDGEVSCLAVHPNGIFVASGQMGRSNAKICIWSAGPHSSFNNSSKNRKGLQSSSYDASEFKYPRYAPEISDALQLPIGAGVAALDFSPDGKYILSIAMNMHHTMTLWNWKDRHPLCSIKSHSSPVYFCRFNPYQFYVDDDNNDVNDNDNSYCVYTVVTGGLNHLKVWTLRYENVNEVDEDDVLNNDTNQDVKSNANRGHANTGYLSKQDRELFTSFRSIEKTDQSTYHRGQWRYSFKPKETDQIGVDRVGYNARRYKGMTMEERNMYNNNHNRNASNNKNEQWCWNISGTIVKTRKKKNVPLNKLPGRDTTLCLCFLPNGLGTGGACITGSSCGHITLWHQQVEQGAAKLIPRITSRRGLVDRIITGWDPVGWQGVTISNGHDGHSVTCIAAMDEHTPDQNLRFLTGGRDNRIVLWDMPCDKVTNTKPKQMLALNVDSCPIGILPSFNKALVTTLHHGLIELDISGETKQLRPNIICHGHTKSVNCIDTYPQRNVPIFCTVGTDSVVRMWSLRERRQLTEATLPSSGISCSFSKNGELLAVGTANGGVLIYGVQSGYPPGLDLRFQDVPSKLAKMDITSKGGDAAGGWPAPNSRNTKSVLKSKNRNPTNIGSPLSMEQPQNKSSPLSSITRLPHSMTAVRFSPNGLYLVSASRDHNLYLYKAWEDSNCLPGSFRQIGVLKGHWSSVTHVDWSFDSTTIMSNGADREILYWNPKTIKQDCATMSKRDMIWDTWTCVLGWPMQGAYSNRLDSGLVHDGIDKSARLFMDGNLRKDSQWLKDIRSGQHGFGSNDSTSSAGEKGIGKGKQKRLSVENMNLLGVSRSNGGNLLATGDIKHQVSIFRYPAIVGSKSKRYRGHGSVVKSVRFTKEDDFLLSTGGLDKSIFLWNVTSSDNDPSILTLNFAHSHLESSRYQSDPSSPKSGPSRLLGNDINTSKRDRQAVLEEERKKVEDAWNYLEDKIPKPPISATVNNGRSILPVIKKNIKAADEADVEKEKMWDYLEEKIESTSPDGTNMIVSPSSLINLVDQEERKKWDYLEDASTEMTALPVFDKLRKKPFRLAPPTTKQKNTINEVQGNKLQVNELQVNGKVNEPEEKFERVPPLFTCFGLFDFNSSGENDDEMKNFKKEELIFVTSIEEEEGWWRGRKNKNSSGGWGLLFPKNRVYQVIQYENEQYMLTTDDEPEIFTLDNGEDGTKSTFIGHWNAGTKTLTIANEDDENVGKTLDWSSSFLLGSIEEAGGVLNLD